MHMPALKDMFSSLDLMVAEYKMHGHQFSPSTARHSPFTWGSVNISVQCLNARSALRRFRDTGTITTYQPTGGFDIPAISVSFVHCGCGTQGPLPDLASSLRPSVDGSS